MAASDHIKDFGENLVEISTKIAFFCSFYCVIYVKDSPLTESQTDRAAVSLGSRGLLHFLHIQPWMR